jgi:TraB/PrgY/gumN family
MAEWQHLYPWAIAMLLDYPALRGVSSIYGVDNHVAELARRYSKRTGGVETVDEHIRVLSDMHMIEGEVYLLQTLVHAAEASPQFRLDVAAWKSGDTNRLYAMHVKRMKEAPTVYWRLLVSGMPNGFPGLKRQLNQEHQHWSSPAHYISLARTVSSRCCKSAVTKSSNCSGGSR